MMKLTEGLSDLSLDRFVGHGLREPLTGKLTSIYPMVLNQVEAFGAGQWDYRAPEV